jgi:uncharacterized protein
LPVQPTYPGVYIQEVSSGIRTISGVSTSVTAFVGYTARGLDNQATRLFSFSDYQRNFGGLASDSELSYSVQQFFNNGGADAYVVRVPKSDGAAATITLLDSAGGAGKQALKLTALSKGAWANGVVADVDYANTGTDAKAFNLTITDTGTGNVETFAAVTLDNTLANYVVAVVNDPDSGSGIVRASVPDATAARPVQTGVVGGDITLTDLKSDKDYSLKFTSDLPVSGATLLVNAVTVTVIAAGDTIPGSVSGICRLVERKTNLAIQAVLPGAAISCVPSASGKGIRILANFSIALFPDAQDAKLTLADGANTILTALQLTNASANVAHYRLGKGRALLAQAAGTAGADGTHLPGTANLIGDPASFTGIYALDKVDLFNLLCIPDATRAQPGNPGAIDSSVDPNSIYGAAMTYCKSRRAFLLLDPPPSVNSPDTAVDWKTSGLTVHDSYGAAYFPRLRLGDPLNNYQLRTFAPSGVMAGLYARTDSTRGIWKAPAGVDATLTGVQGLVYSLTDAENGPLNTLGLNACRSFPVYGSVSWGARTLTGSDAEASEWKYVPVRRLALYIEESLFRGTQWVVFEPNDEPLWAEIRLNIGAFMQNLFRQGAFQGSTPKDAYLVKCDRETTTQDDINRGVVNILVGFASLKPAEFVFISIQQIAAQSAA